MTEKEASFILANIDRRVCDDELNDALDMAIKALELMIFKSSVIMTEEKEQKCLQTIKEQIKEGVVLLPHYIDLISPQEPILDKIREEISEAMDMEPAYKGQDNYIGGLQIACSIIDKYRQEDK